MGKEFQDGLILDHNSILIIDEKKPGFPITARVFQMLAIVIGAWSSISVFIQGVALPVNSLQLDLAILIFAGIMFSLCLVPSYDLVKLFFGILFYALYFYSRFPRLRNSFYILENLVLDRMASYYDFHSPQFVADYTKATDDTTLLVVMILIPIIALITIAIVRNKYVNLSSLVLFLPVSVSFLFGIIPSEIYLIAYVAAVLYLTRSGYSLRHIANKEQKTLIHRINSRAAVWLSLMAIIIFLILKLFVTEDRYKDISEIEAMKSKVQTALFEFNLEDFTKRFSNIRLGKSHISSGGLNGGDLGKTGEVKFENTEQLRVTAPFISANEGIYLKGYVGSEYTGHSWNKHSKNVKKKYKELLKKLPVGEFQPVNQINMLLSKVAGKIQGEDAFIQPDENLDVSKYQFLLGKMDIQYVSANKDYIYAPYFTNYDLINQAYYEQDLYSAPTVRNKSYEFNYYFNLYMGDQPLFYMSGLGDFTLLYKKNEKLYRQFVYDVYTKLPEKGLERLKTDFTAEKIGVYDVAGKIEYVKEYLLQNTVYSLKPGKLPKGEDFVEYFLYTNKKGYCSHYASAATLMLRSLGVPARYVEGYAIGPSEALEDVSENQNVTAYTRNGTKDFPMMEVELSVKDYNAHAWVEVYIDGCGFIPVEFTPGSQIEYNNDVVGSLSHMDDFLGGIKEDDKSATSPDDSSRYIPDRDYTEQNNSSVNDTHAKNRRNEGQSELNSLFLVIFISAVAAVLSVGTMIRVIKKRKLKNTQNHNKKAIFLLSEIERILSFSRCLPKKGDRLEDNEEYVKENCDYFDVAGFQVIMETAKKARFGKGSITAKELMEVEIFRHRLFQKVYGKLSYRKKLYLKFLLFI